MKDLILQAVKKFIKIQNYSQAPLLLGFSGGPDSLALLHLLREYGPLNLHVAHVDHGWRPESAVEAEGLRVYIEKLGLPFYLHTLKKGEKDLENQAREGRFAFFSSLYQKLDCRALLLAHQRDDQSETVLKRFFEGASLSSLSGMRPVSSFRGMELWRPLLSVPKSSLCTWLQKKGLTLALDDVTNRDPRFLRARMRMQIFPELERLFGKAIGPHLFALGETAQELKEYFQRKSPLFSASIEREAFGWSLDFNPYDPIDPVELAFFLRHFLKNEGVQLSSASFVLLKESILLKTCKRHLIKNQLIVDRGVMIFLYQKLAK